MGYTHYWDIKKDNLSANAFKKIKKDVDLILVALGDMINFDYNCDNSVIDFNGKFDEAHENFYLQKGINKWSFCKTARKPYDLAVCLALLCLKYHVEDSNVSSDGDNEEWAKPINLFKQLFPERVVTFDMSECELEMLKSTTGNYKK